MSKQSKKKKIKNWILGSTALVSGATAGILCASEVEAKEEENEIEKKLKIQSTPKKILPKPPKSPNQSYTSYVLIIQEPTIYIDKNGKRVTTSNTDLSNIDTTEIVQIGFCENKKGEIEAVRMPKTIEKVPKQLPPQITSTTHMFQDASVFNQDISNWDTSRIKDMSYMFSGASAFNQDLSQWDTSNVTDMSHMFYDASSFQFDISNWNVLRVTKFDEFATNSIIDNVLNNKKPKFL